MPRYFFHTDGGAAHTDREGLELPGIRQARIEAARAFGQMVELAPEALWKAGALSMTVTDDAGLVLFILDLSAMDSPAAAITRPT
jgi:hypothetical protein